MPRICYVERDFQMATLWVVHQANAIIEQYITQGYVLTLRQLYYQFVARGLIPNRQSEYKRLGSIVNDARLAGLIDWEAITDRTRELRSLAHWDDPAEIVQAAAGQYRIDRWAEQPHRVEVWIEKDALVGVFEDVCNDLDVPLLSCRGYTSQSEMWSAAQRMIRHSQSHEIVVLHFGDHDPSGIDMTRDIADRLALFGASLEVRRIALNMEQVDEYKPPPNPAKQTDSRFTGYINTYGEDSWELDALEPSVLTGLVRREINDLLDDDAWDGALEAEERQRELLQAVSDNWTTVAQYVDGNGST